MCVLPVVAGLLVQVSVPAAVAEEARPVWSYSGSTGPEHWGELSAAYVACAQGRSQSPVDMAAAAPLGYTPLVFQYRSHLLEILNTGNGVRVITPPGSALLVRGSAFDLERLEFHIPGEHRFQGARADAELQLVHRDSRGGSVIVAVPLKAGRRENRILSRILEHFPMRAGERVRHRQVGINPLFLLPSGRSYYRYEGSLTTPPCTESALWYVLSEPLIISPAQLERIREAIGFNARPAQPLNGRVVNLMRR
ncbi:carbonic anhydrase family protein [Thiorhodococcus minor]|uniref:carbonic anhydrase n=1 Tax=Thiorhodococcus minor TaxID=57489 RepID=A0A6M0K3V1_9GAMM|nr:carbonic anhydrase family protein [Thiorhodococcus minor]